MHNEFSARTMILFEVVVPVAI